jgi:DNA-binding LacI/PurR family transcriptional regulator
VLTKHGFRIPDDVAVAGFDDIDEASFSTPTLTTVDPGRAQIATAAVQFLVERMNGDDSDHRELVVPFELHRRESTTGPRS